jgi:hypothetical protein
MAVLRFSTPAIAAMAVTGVLATAITLAALNAFQPVPLDGKVTTINVEVYSESSCTQTCNTINVGELNPGSTTTKIIYVKNTGTVPETLSMTVSDWNPPAASSLIDITWNQQNTVLDAGQSIQAVLTLEAASNTGGFTNFSCNVTFIGTQ